ncbi:MAG: Nif3-like dinuclear metal center hexameric protein [bacterium]|nr:Nif3-like dinuclear metal center hexameric protein [bacterium]
MKLHQIVQAIESVFPPAWALPNDPVGLHLGDPGQEVERVFVALEASSALLKRVFRTRADLLFVHHPLIYRPLKRIVSSDPVQRIARELIRRETALYAAHTNVDLHPEGMAKIWAERLGCVSAEPLLSKPQAGLLKIVTFTPRSHTGAVRTALAQAGAGVIGEYEMCSFETPGTGTFRGSMLSNPFTGEAGRHERVEEERLEMVLPAGRKSAVINALWRAHPYEEPAYDLYSMEDVRDLSQAVWIAEFAQRLTWSQFEDALMKATPIAPTLGGVRPNAKRGVKRIAICTGSGGSLIPLAAGLGVDAFLTGEAGYHDMWYASEKGLAVVTVGHDVSESLFAQTVIPLIEPVLPGVKFTPEYKK